MTIVVVLLALLVTVVLLTTGGRRGAGAAGNLRRAACGLTWVVALALTPTTFHDAGAAAGYLLGVPLVISIIVFLRDLSGRSVLVVEATAGLTMLAWSLLLALGIGLAFLPSALLFLCAFGFDLRTPVHKQHSAAQP
ncbi:hypothetical protein [Tessaracoccus antarcticus]|uniref:Uncharacterized protein n=1 Tax=Tessaracoccus antarcticus TaxID=2479848 RepID=A0A3M0GFJ9_9ACTN|nr:hypothetical protein [Tessaracoccus antarcticus]RMB59899.1 hypothetical protein EAX62_09190 [Tessaracoccus antarcticus]